MTRADALYSSAGDSDIVAVWVGQGFSPDIAPIHRRAAKEPSCQPPFQLALRHRARGLRHSTVSVCGSNRPGGVRLLPFAGLVHCARPSSSGARCSGSPIRPSLTEIQKERLLANRFLTKLAVDAWCVRHRALPRIFWPLFHAGLFLRPQGFLITK
jgi:hypothetical protein